MHKLVLLTYFRTFTVHDVISMLEEEGTFETANIYIDPPPPDELTDEDSAEEEDGGTVEKCDFRQLSAAAEVTFLRRGIRTHYTAEPDTQRNVSSDLQLVY